YERVVASTRAALNEDANFYGRSESLQRNVPPMLKEFSSATDAFIRMTAALSQADDAPEAAESFRASGEHARELSFRLWSTIDAELDELLAHRIDAFKARRVRGLSLTALAVLSAIGFMA